jgi:polyhydroxyalkanoate synthase
MPVLNIFAEQDHLVPPAASRALARVVGSDDYTEISFKGGHIGIYVSGRAQREVPPAIDRWLKARR